MNFNVKFNFNNKNFKIIDFIYYINIILFFTLIILFKTNGIEGWAQCPLIKIKKKKSLIYFNIYILY